MKELESFDIIDDSNKSDIKITISRNVNAKPITLEESDRLCLKLVGSLTFVIVIIILIILLICHNSC